MQGHLRVSPCLGPCLNGHLDSKSSQLAPGVNVYRTPAPAAALPCRSALARRRPRRGAG